jgi:hypothetical protein
VATIFTDHFKPARVIRKVLLRQIAILNDINPFRTDGSDNASAFILVRLNLLLLLGHWLLWVRRSGRWRLVDEIGRVVALDLFGKIVPGARHLQQISLLRRIIRFFDQLQTTHGISPVVF